MKVSRVGEFAAIARVARLAEKGGPDVVAGIGDDAAVLKAGGGCDLLATSDMLVEGVHFNLAYTGFRDLGYKALAVNLSDIAAMGGRPGHYLVAVAVPPDFEIGRLEEIYRGMEDAARPHNVKLVGGDTVASPGPLVISVTLLGKAKQGKAVLRSGARPGDGIYVTGTLGDSAAGLDLLRSGRRRGEKETPRDAYLIGRHLRPTARLEAGRLLGESGLASSMIDLSDGLSSDLRHITELSGCGAEIYLGALPLSAELASFGGRNAIKYALDGGEDYELLFTVRPGADKEVAAVMKRAGTEFKVIGKIVAGKGISAVGPKGGRKALRSKGYEHFKT